MKKNISLISVAIFSLVIITPALAQTSYPGIYPTDNSKNYPTSYPTDYYGTDKKTNYYDSTPTDNYSAKDNYSSTSPYTTSAGASYYPYSTNNSSSNSSNSNSQAADATKQALIKTLTQLLQQLQLKLQTAIAQQKSSSVVQTQTQNLNQLNSIIVTSPNGGEIYATSSTINISWIAPTGNPNSIGLFLTGPSITGTQVINSNIPNTGSCTWQIPSTVLPGSYKIMATMTINNTTISDSSDNYFMIATSTATK